jgi:putative CocE/NonD family hydrolase
MRIVTEFPHAVVETPDMGIVLPDGTRLSARVWMPEDAAANPVPAILEFLPYRKRDGTIERDDFSHPWTAGHGYACVRVDMRGSGDSEGLFDDEYSPQEMQDAQDVIAWLAKQPWCSGAVGMMGISWGGFNSLQLAALRPPALKAIVTVCSTVDRYADDIHYKGGCQLIENFGWAMNMLSYMSRPPDPELVGANRWKDMWHRRLDGQDFLMEPWLEHQHRDAYWQHGSVCEDYSAIEAAVLTVGGWADGYRNTMAHLVANLDAPVKAIAGPWNHKYPHYAGPKPAIGFLQESKRWWDQYLKGIDTGAKDWPAYRAYIMDSISPQRWYDARPGRWVAEQSWPSPAIQPLTFQLTDAGLSDQPGKLSGQVRSDQDTGIEAPEYFPFAFADELAGDQSQDDAKSLCFDSAPLTESLDLLGAPVLRLTLVSDTPTANLVVRLCDLRPDGSSAFIGLGVLNLCHARSHAKPQALVPGQEFDIALDLDQIGYRIPAGHRLRVALSTAYWPFIWPSADRPTLSLSAGSIELPVRPLAAGDECQFDEPEGAPHWQAEALRPASYDRRCFREEDSGAAVVSIEIDAGKNRDLHHGLISSSQTSERWSVQPDDPLSARADITWRKEGGRPGAMWTTLATGSMWCDRDFYYATARLECHVEGEPFFAKDYAVKKPRKLV